jgi:hypothetical protein
LYLALGSFVRPAEAQSGSFSGRVFHDSSGIPLAGVEVALPRAQRGVRTDDRGAFRLSGVNPGRYQVIVRAPGFKSKTDTIEIELDTEFAKDYRLVPAVNELDSVLVTASGTPLTPGMRTFERRRAMGMGTFILPEELRKNEEMSLRFVLTRIPGLRLVLYEGATFAASSRGVTSNNLPRAIPWDVHSPRRCWVQIYVDAIRIYTPLGSRPGGSDGAVVPNISDFTVRNLEAVEFYAGPGQTPADLGGTGATCGTLVLWTRQK